MSGRSILPPFGHVSRFLLVPNVRHDRESDEQRVLVGIVIRQVDAYGQSLHDFDEVARRILGR